MYEHLDEARRQYGYTLEVLAQAVNLSHKTVGNKIHGMGEFTFGEACAIHDRLFPHYDIRWLFERAKNS